MAQRPDPYRILGVAPHASPGEIRRAYYSLAKAAHPDLVGEDGLQSMLRLNAAWEILRDKRRRAVYDASVPPTVGANPVPAAGTNRQAAQPHWTGAAGAPPGRPAGTRIDFGLYAGWTLGEIVRHDAGYLLWLRDRQEGREYASEIQRLLDPILGQPAASAPERGRWSR